MVAFIECLAPVSKKIDDSFGLVGVICCRENEVDHLDENMIAGSSRDGKLVQINILGNLVEKTLYCCRAFEDKSLK